MQLRVDDAGAAYPLAVDPWLQQAKLTASDAAAFGFSVAVSGDTAVVGAYLDSAGARPTSSCARGHLDPAGQAHRPRRRRRRPVRLLGGRLGRHRGGGRTASTAPAAPGSAYVFVRSGGTWTQQQKLTASDGAAGDRSGPRWRSRATPRWSGRTRRHLGADAGSAYVFVRSGGTWTQQQKLTASDGAAND